MHIYTLPATHGNSTCMSCRTTTEKLYHRTFGEYRCDNSVGATMYRLTTKLLDPIPTDLQAVLKAAKVFTWPTLPLTSTFQIAAFADSELNMSVKALVICYVQRYKKLGVFAQPPSPSTNDSNRQDSATVVSL
jgi:hypothetical protein